MTPVLVCHSHYARHTYCHHFFFFTDPATTEIYTLSLHDALPIYRAVGDVRHRERVRLGRVPAVGRRLTVPLSRRSEEHTSELQSHHDLVCRLLLEKKKKNTELTSHTVNLPFHNIHTLQYYQPHSN